MNQRELTYWNALALMPGLSTRKKNAIYVRCYTAIPRINIIELFENQQVWDQIHLTYAERSAFATACDSIASTAFITENLLAQGYKIIPFDAPEYSHALKANLKQGTPTILYTKGEVSLMNTLSTAIVGSRNADTTSLEFTRNVVSMAVASGRVIVSGYAKGVDRQALDVCLDCGGKSIIVLPQGITTFASGFKQYYKRILNGELLVVSCFPPQMPWSISCAMARNSIIYGMANDIYVAQSDDKGGTWAGVLDGLHKNRRIYVRNPLPDEKNANALLVQKGCIAVDMHGNILTSCNYPMPTDLTLDLVSDEATTYSSPKDEILRVLSEYNDLTAKQIRTKAKLNISESKIRGILRKSDAVGCRKIRSTNHYYLHNKPNGLPNLDF